MDLFCDECKNINITEAEQDKLKKQNIQHYCNKYKKPLLHGLNHPKIPRIEECFRGDGKELD
jgi:hypothetical protein